MWMVTVEAVIISIFGALLGGDRRWFVEHRPTQPTLPVS
jgi:hypothetical protein